MNAKSLIAAFLLCCTTATAQTDDPVIMKIAGKDITRSEFEYSYNKNNSEGVIDKKNVEEYVELFVNYKLKVQAALDERMDTLTSYKNEFRQYRDMQIRPALVTEADVEAEAHTLYDNEAKRIGPDGLIKPAHIFVRLSPDADKETEKAKKARIDSLYNALMNGADFTELASKKSEDPGAAKQGGVIGWISHGQTFEEFDKAAYALKDGETSKPVLSPVGWHIIKVMERKQIDPYDTLRPAIMKFIERRNLRDAIANRKVEEMVKESGNTKTAQQIMDEQAAEMEANLQKKSEAYEADRVRIIEELQEEQTVMLNNVSFAIENFIKGYNAEGRYKMILANSSAGPILDADPSMDITQVILAGLNAQYAEQKAGEAESK